MCLLRRDIDDTTKQRIASELRKTVTAFALPLSPGDHGEADPFSVESRFGLRWFSPVAEVETCGHGTVATAAAIFMCLGNSNVGANKSFYYSTVVLMCLV